MLLTRARQGMVIVIPPRETTDPTRKQEFYDPTFDYLRGRFSNALASPVADALKHHRRLFFRAYER